MNISKKEKLSDLKSEYGTACLEEGLGSSFYMALYVVKQILFKKRRRDENTKR